MNRWFIFLPHWCGAVVWPVIELGAVRDVEHVACEARVVGVKDRCWFAGVPGLGVDVRADDDVCPAGVLVVVAGW